MSVIGEVRIERAHARRQARPQRVGSGTLVRTATVVPGHGLCAKGTSISGKSPRGPPLRTARYTPTIRHSTPGPSLVTPGINCSITDPLRQRIEAVQIGPRERVVDDGDALGAGQSCSVKLRPRCMAMPNVRKYSGLTMLKPAPGRCDGSVTGRPTIENGMPKLVPLTGIPVETDADDAPGIAVIFSSSCR